MFINKYSLFYMPCPKKDTCFREIVLLKVLYMTGNRSSRLRVRSATLSMINKIFHPSELYFTCFHFEIANVFLIIIQQ